MKSRTLVNLLLLVVVVILTIAVLQSRTGSGQPILLTSLDREQITSITIPRDKGDIVLKKIDQQWRMQSPYVLRAHEFRVQRLLDLATSAVDRRYDADALQTEKFGLSESGTRIRFNDTLVRYGDVNPINNKRYVQVNKALFLIDDELTPLIRSQPSSFADLSLLDATQTIRKIDFPEFSIYKNEKGLWQSEPENRMDADRMQALIGHWQSAQAFGVHAYLQRKQLGNIRLTLDDDSIIELDISDTSPWLILGRPQLGIEYHFDKSFNEKLLPGRPGADAAGKGDA